jgi:hypothetical protein
MPNALVLTTLLACEKLYPLIEKGAKLPPLSPPALETAFKQLGGIKFPPLSKDPTPLDFWWNNGIKPFIESLRPTLITSPDLASYRKQAEQAKTRSCRDTRKTDAYRAKVDALAWSRFLTDCKNALKRLAPPVTAKPPKKP